MARTGYKKAKYNVIVGNDYKALEKEQVPMFAKVVDQKFAPEFNDAELYANDQVTESDYSFKNGALSVTVDDDEDAFCAEILGNKISEEEKSKGEVTSNINDQAPYIGFGHIVTKRVGGQLKYKVEVLPRVKITSVITENKSRGKDLEYGTTTIEGKVFACDEPIGNFSAGDWEKHQTFDDYALAEAYLDKMLSPKGLLAMKKGG